MRHWRRFLFACLALSAAAARADILLDGHNHVGDCNDTTDIDLVTPGLQTACDGFTPLDPVSRDNMFNTPIVFHLTTTTTIDKVRLDNPISLDGKLNVYIQALGAARTFRSGSLSGSTWDLVPDIVLSPGYYSLLPDGGCSALSGGTYFYTGCAGSGDNDFGFSSITLVSPQTSTSRMLIQRRHPGNPTDPANDNDSDDDYDLNDTGSPYYPDIAEGHPINMGFNLDQNRRISEIRFYRVRDVDSPPGSLLIDGQQVGSFFDTGDPLEVAAYPHTTIFPTNFLALAGNHTLRVALAVISGADVDSFSWDNIVIQTVDVAPGGALGAFNATDKDLGLPLTGTIGTKVANKDFDLSLHAINPLGTGVNTSYTGTVTAEVLDASNNSGPLDIYGCRTSWVPVHTLGSVTFSSGDNGKKNITGVSYPNALRQARVRVTDTTTAASGCSTDPFAVRPKDLVAVASDDSPTTPGTTRLLPTGGYNENTTPAHKAGHPFTMVVTARGEGGSTIASGYDGQPTLTPNHLELATVYGAVSTGAWTPVGGGAVRSDTVTYSEVGVVHFDVDDTTFADIDIPDGTPAAERKFSDHVHVGRFYPDRFKVTKAELSPGCGTFTYFGQPIGFPGGVAVTLAAVNAAGTTTVNYTDRLFKLPATVSQGTFTIYDDPGISGTPTLSVPGGNHVINENLDGTASILVPNFSVTRDGLPMALLASTDIGVSIPIVSDTDGVWPDVDGDNVAPDSPVVPFVLGTAAAGSGVPFTGGNKAMRYGRLYIQPAAGSDRADLPMVMRTEYWDGITFVPSSADACTALTTANVTLSAVPGSNPAQTRAVGSAVPPFGPWTLTLSAPNVAGQAQVSVNVSVVGPYLYLQDDSPDSDDLYNNNPQATATFGVFSRDGDNRIYQREVFR